MNHDLTIYRTTNPLLEHGKIRQLNQKHFFSTRPILWGKKYINEIRLQLTTY